MRFVFCFIAGVLVAGCASTPGPPSPARSDVARPAPLAASGTAKLAIANLAAASGTLVSGRVFLRAAAGGVRITGTIGGFTGSGAHRLQVHERGDCSAIDARSAGAAFDPTGAGQGSGDRILANPDGVSEVGLLVPGAVLGGGAPNDIAGRALVVLDSASGAAGRRVACGVVQVQP